MVILVNEQYKILIMVIILRMCFADAIDDAILKRRGYAL